jgi:hypothetical protein
VNEEQHKLQLATDVRCEEIPKNVPIHISTAANVELLINILIYKIIFIKLLLISAFRKRGSSFASYLIVCCYTSNCNQLESVIVSYVATLHEQPVSMH